MDHSPPDDPAAKPMGPGDWEARYAHDSTPWDLGQPNPALVIALSRAAALGMPAPGRALLPACGRGHDAIPLLKAGWSVVGVDLAPSAVAISAAAWARFGRRGEAVQGDVLALPPPARGPFDLVVEHTCLCALDPALEGAWAASMAGALEPGGWLVGIFFHADLPDGPPFGIPQERLAALVEPAFEILLSEPAEGSIARRQRVEEWSWVLRRR